MNRSQSPIGSMIERKRIIKFPEAKALASTKIFVIGNSGVGKSCLCQRLTSDEFVPDMEPTVGVSYWRTKARKPNGDRLEIMLNIFDGSGHNSFDEIRNEF